MELGVAREYVVAQRGGRERDRERERERWKERRKVSREREREGERLRSTSLKGKKMQAGF